MSQDNDELEKAAQVDIIRDLTERIGKSLDYVDWLASSTDISETYLEQLSKLLDGEQNDY